MDWQWDILLMLHELFQLKYPRECHVCFQILLGLIIKESNNLKWLSLQLEQPRDVTKTYSWNSSEVSVSNMLENMKALRQSNFMTARWPGTSFTITLDTTTERYGRSKLLFYWICNVWIYFSFYCLLTRYTQWWCIFKFLWYIQSFINTFSLWNICELCLTEKEIFNAFGYFGKSFFTFSKMQFSEMVKMT